jgi:hypothetical protein
LYRKKINPSTYLAGQAVGIKEVDDGIWLVSSMQIRGRWLTTSTRLQLIFLITPTNVPAYLLADKRAPSTSTDYAVYLRGALTSVGNDIGPVQNLHDTIEPVQPEHDDRRYCGMKEKVAIP